MKQTVAIQPLIRIFAPQDYKGPIPVQPRLSGKMGYTHLAFVAIDGRPRHCYVKTYLDDGYRLANEIAGYCLNHISGVPGPAYAGLISLPSQVIQTQHPSVQAKNAAYPAWVTSDMTDTVNPTTTAIAKILYNLPAEIGPFLDDFSRWNDLPAMLAVDEWTANVDRNAGNLFRHGPARYSVFDHGELLSGGDWPRHDLAWNATYKNKMLDVLRRSNRLSLPIKSAILMKAAALPNIHPRSLNEYIFFWQNLMTSTQFASAVTFLECRSRHASARFSSRVGLIV